jgi:hypothetical protein
VKVLLDARDLQAEYGLNRRQSYEVLHRIGVRITPGRLVVLRERLLAYLSGEVVAP